MKIEEQADELGFDETGAPIGAHDDRVAETIQPREQRQPPLARLNAMLKLIAHEYGVGTAMAVQAGLTIAGSRWTVDDELRFGWVTRDELGNLIGKDVKYDT